MNTSALLVTILTSLVLFSAKANAAAAMRTARDYLPETSRNAEDHSSCCVIPTCDQYGRCYETLSCGYVCGQGKYPPANIGATHGYTLREFYSKYDCMFGECKEYKFLCSHCPDPKTQPDFSYYTVRDDCKSCYDRPRY